MEPREAAAGRLDRAREMIERTRCERHGDTLTRPEVGMLTSVVRGLAPDPGDSPATAAGQAALDALAVRDDHGELLPDAWRAVATSLAAADPEDPAHDWAAALHLLVAEACRTLGADHLAPEPPATREPLDARLDRLFARLHDVVAPR